MLLQKGLHRLRYRPSRPKKSNHKEGLVFSLQLVPLCFVGLTSGITTFLSMTPLRVFAVLLSAADCHSLPFSKLFSSLPFFFLNSFCFILNFDTSSLCTTTDKKRESLFFLSGSKFISSNKIFNSCFQDCSWVRDDSFAGNVFKNGLSCCWKKVTERWTDS